jgi:hypothetical protein
MNAQMLGILPNLEISNAEAAILVETAQQKNKKAVDYKAPYKGNYQLRNCRPVYYPQSRPTPEVFIPAPQQRQAKIQRRNNSPDWWYPPLPVLQTEIFK